MGYEKQGISGIGTAKSYQEEEQVKKETDLESLLKKLESLNKDLEDATNKIESLSDRLRSEPIATGPENDAKIPPSGLISRLNVLLNQYQYTIGRNQQCVSRLESII